MGSAFIRFGLKQIASCEALVNLDLLTYAGNCKNLKEIEGDPRYLFVQGDICDEKLVEQLCREGKIDTLVHFAAETHVDRSISSPKDFLQTNVCGTSLLLEVVRKFPQIHFHQISTDEVFGALGETGIFTEQSSYKPSSPYSASKAAADHFVRGYAHTFGLSVTLSHSSNNYGPYQYPEKIYSAHDYELPAEADPSNLRFWEASARLALCRRSRRGCLEDFTAGATW